ncbi:MAG TPA: RNA methyltransferase substrate-binding domain-containing protein, partial [Candidatus Binataceae bacterium]|nr:RNA methyltransferase substrate-binding domain-containing protein [Candidatus Binataceae bacterium]
MKNRGYRGRARSRNDRRAPHQRDDARGTPPHAQPGERATHPPRHHERLGNDHNDAPRNDLVFGIEPVRELITAAPGSIRTLYIRTGDEARFEEEMDRVRIAGGEVAFAEEAEIARNCGRDARHQGIAAIVREYQYVEFEDMVEAKPDPIVLVDGVTDPRNLGA